MVKKAAHPVECLFSNKLPIRGDLMKKSTMSQLLLQLNLAVILLADARYTV